MGCKGSRVRIPPRRPFIQKARYRKVRAFFFSSSRVVENIFINQQLAVESRRSVLAATEKSGSQTLVWNGLEWSGVCDKCATKTLLSRAHHRATGKLESCHSGQRALRVVAVTAEWSGGLAVTSGLPRSMTPLLRLRTFTGRLFPVTVRQPIHRLFVETSYQPVNTVICACSMTTSIPTPWGYLSGCFFSPVSRTAFV